MIERELEKINRPLNELTLEDLKRKELTEYFIGDQNLLKERKELIEPIKKRLKYTVFYDLCWFLGLIVYCRNINYYSVKYFPKRRKGIGNLLLVSAIHTIGFVVTLAIGNLLVLRVNPYTFYIKSRDLNKRLIESDPYKGIAFKEFMLKYAEIEEIEEKKRDLIIQLDKLIADNKII